MVKKHAPPLIFLILILLTAWPAHAAESQLFRYDNGLTLLVLPRPEDPVVHVETSLSLRGAARNAGLAHMVEHLMFSTVEGAPAGSLADSLLLLTTDQNAYTSSRYIQTDNTCLPPLLPRLLKVEADRFGRLAPDSLSLEFERERILGEHDWRHENSRTRAAIYRLLAMAYGEGRDGGDPRLGSHADIRSMTLGGVREFLQRWFRPDRMVVSIVGPVDPQEVREQVGVTLGALPAATEDLPADEPLPEVAAASAVDSWDLSERDMLAVAFRLPCGTADEMAMLQLTHSIMEAENGHPLLLFFEDEALLIIRIWGEWGEYISDEEAARDASAQFWGEVRKVRYRVKNDWLYARNKTSHLEDLRDELENPLQRHEWRAQLLAYDRDLPGLAEMVAMADSLDQEDIQQFFDEQFVQERAFELFYAGREQESGDLAGLTNRRLKLGLNPYLNRSRRPVQPEEFPVELLRPILAAAARQSLGRVTTHTLPGGIPLHEIAVPGSEDVALGSVRRHACPASEAAGETPGRLLFYGWLVNIGYDRKGGNIDPRGQSLAWETVVAADLEGVELKAMGPGDRLEDVAAAMHKRMVVDRLNPWGLKYMRENYDEFDRVFNGSPWMEARRWRMGRLLGEDHPHAAWLLMDQEGVTSWSIEKVNRWHRDLMDTGDLRIICAGPAPGPEIENTLEGIFADLDERDPEEFPLPEPVLEGSDGRIFEAPDSETAMACLSFPPVSCADSPLDFRALNILVKSRLEQAMVSTGLDSVYFTVGVDPLVGNAAAQILAVCRPQDAAVTLDLLRRETARLSTSAPTQSEEMLARLMAVRGLVQGFQDPETSRDLFLEWSRFGTIPEDPLACLAQDSPGGLGDLAKKLFPADHLVWTVIGPAGMPPIH